MIDEKKLIEVIKNVQDHMREKNVNPVPVDAREIFTLFIDMVEKQPKVDEWIPVSERLPNKDEYLKDDGRFIVTDGNRVYQSIYDIYSAHCFRTLRLFDFGSRSNFKIDNCVIAWKQLPEPYKEEP